MLVFVCVRIVLFAKEMVCKGRSLRCVFENDGGLNCYEGCADGSCAAMQRSVATLQVYDNDDAFRNFEVCDDSDGDRREMGDHISVHLACIGMKGNLAIMRTVVITTLLWDLGRYLDTSKAK